MSQGPLIKDPSMVSTGLPMLSSTIRHPAWTVADVPSEVGRLPTITQPVCKTASAVVSPTPPGQGPGSEPELSWAKTLSVPLGDTSTIVVPVPCKFELALKLLTR